MVDNPSPSFESRDLGVVPSIMGVKEIDFVVGLSAASDSCSTV